MISLDHVNLVTTRLTETKAFYCEAFGLTEGWSPPEPWKEGAWLYASNGKPILHVQAVSDETYEKFRALAAARYVAKPIPPLASFAGTGAIDHISLGCDDFEGTCARLKEMNIAYQTLEMPTFGVRQIFVEDPNGVLVEINCDAAATAPAD